MREGHGAVRREPGRELIARLEFDAVAPRGRADIGRAVIPTPGGLTIEIQKPARRCEVEAVPEPSARADLFTDCPRQRRDGWGREHAAYVVGVKAVAPIDVH